MIAELMMSLTAVSDTFLTPGNNPVKQGKVLCRECSVRGQFPTILDLAAEARPLKNTQNYSTTALWAQNFLRLRRAKGASPLGPCHTAQNRPP